MSHPNRLSLSTAILWAALLTLAAGCASQTSLQPMTTASDSESTILPYTNTAAVIEATDIPTPQPSATSSPQPTFTSTATFTPTATTVPAVYALIMENMVNVRSGADPVFPSLASFASGLRLEVIGHNPDNSWFLVKIAPQTTGWISAEVVQLDQELTGLPEVSPPPTPMATSTPVAPPQVIVSPSSAIVRTYISITIRNFKPRETVTIQVLTESGGLIETLGVVANDEGTKTDGFWTPSNMKKGTHRVVARGDKGSVASATLTITK